MADGELTIHKEIGGIIDSTLISCNK